MQDEGSAKKGLNPVLERHWDRIVLGAVAVGFVIFLGGQFSSSKSAPAKKVEGVVKAFEDKKNAPNTNYPSPKPPAVVKMVVPAMAIKAPEWAIAMPTKHIPDIREPKELAPVGFFLPKLTLSAPTATVDGVELRWNVSGEPDKDQKPAPIKVPANTFFYRIERRKKGDKEWQVLQKELKSGFRYIDRTTAPKTEYEYQVTLGSTDPVWEGKNPGRLSDKVGGPYATTTPGIWEFSFSNVTKGDPDAEPPIPPTVYVKIVKYDPEYGKVEWSKIHKDKAPLGIADNGDSKHAVFSPKKGRTVEVDFNSGGRIVKIEAEKSELYTHKVCHPKIGDGGIMECSGPEERKEVYKVNVITFIDEEGKQQFDQKETGSGKFPDRLCPDHGGAPPPKALSPEELAAQKEKEVENLLDEADRLWDSEDPADRRKAQEKYITLIRSHAESTAVKARRTDINDRVRKRVE